MIERALLKRLPNASRVVVFDVDVKTVAVDIRLVAKVHHPLQVSRGFTRAKVIPQRHSQHVVVAQNRVVDRTTLAVAIVHVSRTMPNRLHILLKHAPVLDAPIPPREQLVSTDSKGSNLVESFVTMKLLDDLKTKPALDDSRYVNSYV